MPLPKFSDLSLSAATGGDPADSPFSNSPHLAAAPAPAEQPDAPALGPGLAGASACLVNSLSYSGAGATGGDPSGPPSDFSPDLARTILDRVDCVSSVWPAFADLRAAAHATKQSRLRIVISAAVCEARLVFAASFFVAQGAPRTAWPHVTATGSILHSWIRALLAHGAQLLQSRWLWSQSQAQLLHAHLSMVVAPSPWTAVPAAAPPVPLNMIDWARAARPYPAVLCTFLHALRVGAPWSLALHLFADLPHGHFSSDGRIFASPLLRSPGGQPDRRIPLAAPEDRDALTLFFAGPSLVAVASSVSLLPRPTPAPSAGLIQSPRGTTFASRFMPSYFKLNKLPQRDIMSVYNASAAWHRRLGPLDATAATVVEGRFHMPKPRLTLRPSRRPNHSSWERNEAAKIALGPKFATWIWQGIVEMVPRNCPLPLFIEPLGAVDKATPPWWRLILDARISNEFQDAWGVWYFSVSQLAALLDVCDIMFAEDLEDAYHLSIFSGCTGRPFWSRVFTIDEHGQVVARWRLVMGCDVYSCLGLCDKAMSGFCIDGFVGRFAAAHFGQRNAGSPLNVLMRCIQRFLARRAPRTARPLHTARAPEPAADTTAVALPSATPRGLHPTALHSAVWVDDAVYVTKTAPHPPCAGLLGGCPICHGFARQARRSQHGWHRLADELGLGLSADKRQLPSQRVSYTGMVVDTFHRTLSIPPDKEAKLAAFLEDFFARREATLSELASLRGRVQHYSACLPYIAPFVALFSSVIGTEADPDYDRTVHVPPVVCEAVFFIRGVLGEFATRGRPLWPFVPSTLHAAFLAGETGLARIVVITWDASLHGWGMSLRWWANRDGKVIIGSLPDTEDMRHQVRRETFAGELALEAAASEVDLTDAWVILRNDAVGALTALRKGSFSSTFLQQCAMRSCRLQHRVRCNTLFLHAPGRTLVEEGIDDLSRAGALEITGPVSSQYLRERACALARDLGWPITVDAFATEANALVPRFFARYAEPRAEAEDAFTVPDWACSTCPHCAQLHRETLFAFPPPPLLNAFVAKARADGARAIVVAPLSVASPSWNKLLRASVIRNGEGYIRVRRQHPFPDADVAGELALFAVDFAATSSRTRLSPPMPPCGREACFRGRDPLGSPYDQAERARIHAELAAVGLALRR